MAIVEMVMPKMGESVMEATVIRWLKKEGDYIEQDESVLEVATDKVDTDVPAIKAGYLQKILVQEGDVVQIGKAIAYITTNREEPVLVTEPLHLQAQSSTSHTTNSSFAGFGNQSSQNFSSDKDRFYSPLVLNIARQEGIGLSELETIPGTGKDNRVTKYDILDYISTRHGIREEMPPIAVEQPVFARTEKQHPIQQEKQAEQTQEPTLQQLKPTVSYSGEFEIVEMDRMRKMIAQRMSESVRIAPHVTTFVEADVSNIVQWRGRVKHDFLEKEGEPLTYTPIMVEAISRALKDYPMLNASVDGDRIIIKKDINIGIAVALEDGNLIVPVIKNADQYNLVGLTKRINSTIKKAKAGKLTADDLKDGTYTISNVGTFGNLMGTPILVQPQVGIMALGAIKKKPAVIETDSGDSLGIRQMMFLSHSYDHRIIDGALGGSFVRKVADYLENFDVSRKYNT